jgi:hypothetical protein
VEADRAVEGRVESGFWVKALAENSTRRKSSFMIKLQAAAQNTNTVVPIQQLPSTSTHIWVRTTASLDAAALLRAGQSKLRCVEFSNLSLDFFKSYEEGYNAMVMKLSEEQRRAQEQATFALGRPVKSAEKIDYFV